MPRLLKALPPVLKPSVHDTHASHLHVLLESGIAHGRCASSVLQTSITFVARIRWKI